MNNKFNQNHNQMVIALDGPAGSGKSSLAKLISEETGYFQVDSGALYRSYTYIAVQFSTFSFASQDSSTNTKSSLADVLKDDFFWAYVEEHPINVEFKDGKQIVYWQGENIDTAIRTPEITSQIKEIADNYDIRIKINQQLQMIGNKYDIVADGRDMGTVVFPNAKLKIFVTASVEIRAKRRFDEFKDKNANITLQEVIDQIKKRDYEDENREFGALKPAEDSIILDTTNLSLKLALTEILQIISENKKIEN